jgi:hypothetical protein
MLSIDKSAQFYTRLDSNDYSCISARPGGRVAHVEAARPVAAKAFGRRRPGGDKRCYIRERRGGMGWWTTRQRPWRHALDVVASRLKQLQGGVA